MIAWPTIWGVRRRHDPFLKRLYRAGTRDALSLFFPEQWDRLRAALPLAEGDRDVVDACHRLLHDPDPAVRARAAEAWCLWESATPYWPPREGMSQRFRDPAYALAFARIVTHYVRHNAWLEDGILLRRADALRSIRGVLVNGRFDFQAPIENAWVLRRAWPRAELVIVDDAGHGGSADLDRALASATQRFGATRC